MIRWFRRYRNVLWIGITVAMLVSIVGIGGYQLTSKDFSESVATVGGVKIPYIYYRRVVDRAMEQVRKDHKDATDALEKEVKMEVLQQLVMTQICASEAKDAGLQVSDEELSWAIHQDPQFQTGGAFNQPLYIQTVLQGYNMTVEDFEQNLRRQLAAGKYQALVFSAAKLIPDEVRQEYKRSHGGLDKNFDKDEEKFAQSLHRIRALSTLQSAMRHAANHLDIRTFLQEREGGA